MRSDALVLFIVFAFALLIVMPVVAAKYRPGRSLWFGAHCLWIVACAFLAVVAGARGRTAGFDTAAYVATYESLQSLETAWATGAVVFGNTELLFWPLQYLFQSAGVGAELWVCIIVLLSFGLVTVCYRELSSQLGVPWVVVVFLLLSYFLVYLGNAMRQMLAFPLGVLAVVQFYRGKYLRTLVLLVIGVGLHWSTMIFALAPLSSLVTSRWRFLCLTLFCLAVGLLDISPVLQALPLISQVESKVEYYMVSESHISAVYKTANFWLCAAAQLILIVRFEDVRRSQAFLACAVLFFSLMLLGLRLPDFSERFMAQMLFLFPLALALFLRPRGASSPVGRSLIGLSIAVFFVALGAAVLAQPSTKVTLNL